MSNSDRNTRNCLRPDQLKPFRKLAASLVTAFGSQKAAANFIGIGQGHMSNILDPTTHLTIGTAKKILAAHKKLKTQGLPA